MDIKELLKAFMEDEHIEIPSNIILDSLIEDSKNSIKKYSTLNEEEYNLAHLEIPTAKLAKLRYVHRKNIGIRNMAEGNKSKSYELEEIPNEIKSTLPNPKIVFF